MYSNIQAYVQRKSYIETHRKFRNCYIVVFVFGMHLNTKEYLIDVFNCCKKMKYTISVLVVQRSDLYINVYGNFFKFKPYYINIHTLLHFLESQQNIRVE